MDKETNKLKLQANSGIHKNRAFKITRRWIENMPKIEWSAIQEGTELKNEIINFNKNDNTFQDENKSPNLSADYEYSCDNDNQIETYNSDVSIASTLNCTWGSDCNKEETEIYQIRDWVITNNIPVEQVNGLLEILRRRLLPYAPLTAEALLYYTTTTSSAASSNITQNHEILSRTSSVALNDQDFRIFMMSNIAQISSDIAEMKGKAIAEYIFYQTDFCVKYHLKLPLETSNEFEDFNQKIILDKEFHKNLSIFIRSRLIVSDNISKILIPVLKIFLTKGLVQTFTVVKRIDNRINFTNTPFSECLRQALYESRQKYGGETKLIDFIDTVTDIISNCREWDGYHQYQRKKKSSIFKKQ